MIDAAALIDDEVLVYELLIRDFTDQTVIPEVTIAASVDVDEHDPLPIPFVTFTTTGEGQSANGPGLWDCTLNISCMADGLDAAKALAALLYGIVHAWSDPTTSTIPGIGGINEVVDLSKPSRQPSAVVDRKVLVQYDAAFSLQLRN